MTQTTIQCPTCKGSGEITNVLIRPMHGNCYVGILTCFDCQGAGTVSKQRIQWKEQGEAMRLDRISRDMSLREEARRRGMTAPVLSGMEHGRIEPVAKAGEESSG